MLIGFILGTPYHIYRFLATSEEEKNSWFTTLHKMIFAQKQLFSKVSHRISYMYKSSCMPKSWSLMSPQLLTHLSIPDEIFTYHTFQARLPYVGMSTNGREAFK